MAIGTVRLELSTPVPIRAPVASATARIGTAGWSVPRVHAAHFPQQGSHLERYAARFDAAEINSSFHRPHRTATYERWAAAVPDRFRFAVKIPKVISHERRLQEADADLDRFLAEVRGLGRKLGPLLLQLPPNLPFETGVADRFLCTLVDRAGTRIVCEPRHPSWFTPDVEALFNRLKIARVAADPAPVPAAAQPGGFRGLSYRRLHGSPRIYFSPYGPEALAAIAFAVAADAAAGAEAWCIFDNTASAAAAGDALAAKALLETHGPGKARPAGKDGRAEKEVRPERRPSGPARRR